MRSRIAPVVRWLAVGSVTARTAVVAGCARHPASHSLLYVSDEQEGNVAVVDPASAVVAARIPVGRRPRGLKISPDGSKLYVAVSGSPRGGPGGDAPPGAIADRSDDGLAVVDVATRKLVTRLPGGQDPEAFDVSPDGKTAYVSNEETAELSVVDLEAQAIRGKVRVGREPEGVTVRADGRFVFVTSEADNEVAVVDAAALGVVAHVPVGTRPRAIVVTRDGATGFVTDELGSAVTVVDTVRFVPGLTIAIHQDSPTPAGVRPMGAAFSPDQKWLYVSCGRGGSVAVIDVAARKQVRSIDGVGDRPWGLASSADGALLFAANGTSHDLAIVRLDTGNVERRVYVGGLPWGVVRAP